MSGPTRADVRLAEDEVPAKVPFGFLALVLAFGAVLSVAAWLLLLSALGPRAHLPQPERAPAAIQAVRQTLITVELPGQRLFQQQREALDRFGWVDREAGVVQIPVDEAARLLIEEGP